ncbi:MAG TPA: isochorismate synthase [Solirubrobacteraceae bacterium]|jgi:salicylate biosynthesis isochorismate synthase/menaquinone-specific isochorismate synthase
MVEETLAPPPERFALPPPQRQRLLRELERARRRARRDGDAVAAVSWRLGDAVDPAAVVLASRAPGESWMCFEQPEREHASLAALGSVVALEDSGHARFERTAARWRDLLARACVADSDGGGLLACGGFAFAPDGGSTPPWSAFAAASLVVPEVALVRRGSEVWCTVAVLARAGEEVDALEARVQRSLGRLRERALPLLDPHPATRHRISAPMAPEHYEAAVARAVELIEAGRIEKIVLAREVDVHAPGPHDVAAVFGVLREAFGGCFVYAVGRGEATFIGATPEVLVRRDALRVSTVALAGSIGRSADPAVDDHLGERLLRSAKDREEHAIVARQIEQALRPHSVWVTAAEEPEVVRIANIQHLATAIRAQLTAPVAVVELAGMLHPTPAVGGEPNAVALPLIRALEGIDRGWYAGALGWTDSREDGEFCVALRCALVEGSLARCYAGVGVVADSDPAAELHETEVKLAAILPLLSA